MLEVLSSYNKNIILRPNTTKNNGTVEKEMLHL